MELVPGGVSGLYCRRGRAEVDSEISKVVKNVPGGMANDATSIVASGGPWVPTVLCGTDIRFS